MYILIFMSHIDLSSLQSGAIIAMIGMVGSRNPDASLSIAFVDQLYPHSFTAATVCYSITKCACVLIWCAVSCCAIV